jgi:sulfatase modifying factor 1
VKSLFLQLKLLTVVAFTFTGCVEKNDPVSKAELADNPVGPAAPVILPAQEVPLKAPDTLKATPLPEETEPEGTDANLVGSRAGELREFSDLKIKMVWCPPGKFIMGSPESDSEANDDEKPQVDVTLSRGFWLGQTEVTQGLWNSEIDTQPWKDEMYVKEGAGYPATNVSWVDANEFCDRLSEREQKAGRLPAGWKYQLPTEAQWEYACRAGTTTSYSVADDAELLGIYAWLDMNTWVDDEKYPHQVGSKRANPWGLFDIHGNVWEWCRDGYATKLLGGRDPIVAEGSSRVLRGGSWFNSATHCRSAHRRVGYEPSSRYFSLGFRLSLSPSK